MDTVPYTAAAYDELTKPAEPPFPSMCMQTKKGCKCFTQQSTRIEMADDLCRSIVKGGIYLAWQSSDGGNGQVRGDKPARSEDKSPRVVFTGSPAPAAPVAQREAVNDSTNPRFNVALRGQ